MKPGDEDDIWDGEYENGDYRARPRSLVVRGRNQPALARPSFRRDEIDDGLELNFLQYWHLLLKHRWVVASAIVAAMLLGLLVTLLTTPVYRATVLVQIDRDIPQIMSIQGVEPNAGIGDREFQQTQYTLLQSRSLAERVVQRLNLADDPGFMDQKRESPVSAAKRLLKGNPAAEPVSAGDRTARERRAARILLSGLTIEPVRGSNLVRVSYESANPRTAARISNALVENFIGANLDRRFESTSYARKFLEERLQQVKTRLETSERELVRYASEQQLVSVTSGEAQTSGEAATQSLTASNLSAMNTALAAVKGERIRAEQRWRQASVSGMSLPEILQSPTVQALRQSQASLRAQYQEKLSIYKPDFPSMVQLKGQIDEIDRQIQAEVQTIKDSLRAQYQGAQRQEAALQQQVTGLTSGVVDLRNRGIQYNILQREVETNRTLYDGLLQRYKEIGVAGGLGNNNISIVDRAEAPGRPYKPNLMLNLAIAAGIGLLLGVGGAFALESLDETVKVPEDIEGKLGIPLLGSIPILDKGITPEEALADARSPFSEAYYSVRTALQFSTSEGVPRSILITSARPSEGKSTTAVALAKNFAKLGIKVLLVDADLRNPSLHRILHADSSAGLSNYLAGRSSLAELVQVTNEPNLGFMPCGPLPPNPAELLAGSKVRALIDDAAKVFDLVIIDGPPVMGLADAPLLASVISGTALVIEAGTTRQGLIKATLRRLDLGHARILGGILSKFSVKHAGYGYGYGYGYAYSYDYAAKKIEAK